MPDLPVTSVIRTYVRSRLHVVRPLRNRLRVARNVKLRPEGRVHAILEVEDLIPGGEILEQVRQMHVRPVREVPRSAEVGVAEGLDVRDLRRAEPSLLRGRETKEELRSVRNEIGPGDACGDSHLLWKAGTTVEASTDEPLANARDLEETAQLVEDRVCTDGDVVERVAAEQDGDVVRLENHGVGIGREADRVLEHAYLLPSRC